MEKDFPPVADRAGDVTAKGGPGEPPRRRQHLHQRLRSEDFANFPAGSIALIQRGTCNFEQKAENAADAGAAGVIIFNQGNTDDRKGLENVTVGESYEGGIPVIFATYDNGVAGRGPRTCSCTWWSTWYARRPKPTTWSPRPVAATRTTW